jgi:hypothetical protein
LDGQQLGEIVHHVARDVEHARMVRMVKLA